MTQISVAFVDFSTRLTTILLLEIDYINRYMPRDSRSNGKIALQFIYMQSH